MTDISGSKMQSSNQYCGIDIYSFKWKLKRLGVTELIKAKENIINSKKLPDVNVINDDKMLTESISRTSNHI